MVDSLSIPSDLINTVTGLAVVAVGLLMWGAGSRIVRLTFLGLGLLTGAVLGWASIDLVPPTAGLAAWMLPVLAALVVGTIAVVTCRLAVAVALAVALGLAVPVGMRALADVQPDLFGLEPSPAQILQQPATPQPLLVNAETTTDSRDELDDWLDKIAGRATGKSPVTRIAAETATDVARAEMEEGFWKLRDGLGLDAQATRTALEHVRTYLDPVIESGIEWWRQTPARLQPILIAAAAAAALAGALVGSLAPNASAALVTSLAGSMMWMTGAAALVWRADVPVAAWWPQHPTPWVVCWIVISIIGLAIQWTMRTRRADKAS